MQNFWRECLWQFATKTLWALFVAGARIRVVFYDSLPKDTGFILASNHISHFDPPIITLFFPRRIDWIGRDDGIWRDALQDAIPADQCPVRLANE